MRRLQSLVKGSNMEWNHGERTISLSFSLSLSLSLSLPFSLLILIFLSFLPLYSSFSHSSLFLFLFMHKSGFCRIQNCFFRSLVFFFLSLAASVFPFLDTESEHTKKVKITKKKYFPILVNPRGIPLQCCLIFSFFAQQCQALPLF